MAETISSVTTKLDRAVEAYDKLMTGQSVVEFQDSNGERVRYTQANSSKLAGYISKLELKLAELQGTTPTVKPMKAWF